MAELREWLATRGDRDRRLYEQFGKPLEKDHTGEYAAIGPDGRTIVGKVAADVLQRAVETFGSGNFALTRVGHRTFGRWLNLNR
jgi:hypothetical protein